MATKKQKRAAGIARREQFEEDVKASGLRAQSMSKEIRTLEQTQKHNEARKLSYELYSVLDNASY